MDFFISLWSQPGLLQDLPLGTVSPIKLETGLSRIEAVGFQLLGFYCKRTFSILALDLKTIIQKVGADPDPFNRTTKTQDHILYTLSPPRLL